MFKTRSRLRKLLPVLLIVGTSLAAALWYWAALRSDQDRQLQAAHHRSELRATQLNEALTQQFDATLRSVDFALRQLRAVYVQRPQNFEHAVQDVLASFPAGLIEFVTVFDAQGHLTYVSNQPAQRLDIDSGDREHFRVHADGVNDRLFVSAPIVGRVAGKPLIQITRGMWEGKQFRGVIGIPVRPDYLSNHLIALRVDPADLLAVVRLDGRLIARSHNLDEALKSTLPPDRPFLMGQPGEKGLFRSQSTFDKIPMLFSWQRFLQWPLVTVSAINEDAELAPLLRSLEQERQHTVLTLSLVIAFSFGVSVLMMRIQRKNAELARSEARHRALFESSKIPVMLIDPVNGGIVVANEAAARFYGYSREHLARLKISDINQLTAEAILADMVRAQKKECSTFQFSHRLASGEVRPVEVHSGPMEIDGRVLLYSFIHDITDRKRAQAALKEGEAFKQDILDSMVAQIAVLDRSGVILAVNEPWRRYAIENSLTPGLAAPRTSVGVNYLDVCRPGVGDDAQEIEAAADGIRGVLEGSLPNFSLEYPCHTPTQQHWFRMMVTPLGRTQSGRAVVTHTDITKRIQDAHQIDLLLREQKAILNNALVGIVTVKERRIMWANPAFETMMAYMPGEMTGLPTRTLYRSEEAYQTFAAEGYAVIATGEVFRAQAEFLRKDTQTVWLNVSGSTLNKETGESLWGFVDISALVRSEAQLKESEERFRTIADYTYDWEYWEADDGQMLYVSPACERVSGYSQADFYVNKGLLKRLIHPEDADAYATHVQQCSSLGDASISFRIIRKDGSILWIAHGCRPVFSSDGHSLGRRANNRDVTDLKDAEDLASQLAYSDALTNLPNRRMLQIRLDQGLAQALRFHRSLAVLFLDLDRFKDINDRYGHEIGDGLLMEVGKRLGACIRAGDTVARPGGDEFIILLPEIASAAEAIRVAQKVIHTFDAPMQVGQHTLSITTSVGIAVLPVDAAADGQALMKMADTAMYVAKGAGRNRYHLYAPDDEPSGA